MAISECGHDVLAVAAMADLAGSPDDVVLEAASAAGRCLFTENVRDFAVLIRHIHHHGVLFVNAQRWRWGPACDQPLKICLIPGACLAFAREKCVGLGQGEREGPSHVHFSGAPRPRCGSGPGGRRRLAFRSCWTSSPSVTAAGLTP